MYQNNFEKKSSLIVSPKRKPIGVFSVEKKVDFSTAVFDITLRCNDRCAFCFNKSSLNCFPDLSFAEIQQKFSLVVKKYFVREVIISGGEPTLHPEFWEVMEFFCNSTRVLVSLNTNGILFQEKVFSKRLIQLLKTAKNKKRSFSLSLSNVDHFPPSNQKEKRKIKGVLAAIKVANASNTHPIVVFSVTKQNYHILPKLVKAVLKNTKQKITISIRGLYLGSSMSAEQKLFSVPQDFSAIKQFVIAALAEVVKHPNAKIRLFNLPFCYFREWNNLPLVIDQQQSWWHERRIKVRNGVRMKPNFFKKDNWANIQCTSCALESICSKIQPEYLEKYNYPPLTPF